ncbi:MAG: hypothetical protein EOO01_09445, partial [Chitinophagaceae bacterium]
MTFYSNSKEERKRIAGEIADAILADIDENSTSRILEYFNDDDTYIRKTAYIAVGNIVKGRPAKLSAVIEILNELITHSAEHVRQQSC